MNFKTFITLQEEVKLIKNRRETHDVSYLGLMGWWDVYIAYEKNKPTKQIITNNYNNICIEATHLLGRLGFNKTRSNILVIDLSKDVNPITGGGVGGYAKRIEHGIEIDPIAMTLDTVIHEHAHMMWFLLPKPNKKFFQDYYYKKITSFKFGPEDWKDSPEKPDTKELIASIDRHGWYNFKQDLERILTYNLHSYFSFKEAYDRGDIESCIHHAVLSRQADKCNAILKKPILVENYSGMRKQLNVGDEVIVDKVNNGYILQWYTPKNERGYDTKLELQGMVKEDEINDYVTISKDTLSEYQKLKLQKMIDYMKAKPGKFFADMAKSEEINTIFEDSAKYALDYWKPLKSASDHYSSRYSVDQVFRGYRFFNSWVSRIGRRFTANKINNVDDIKKTYMDVMKDAIKLFNPSATPNKFNADDLSSPYNKQKVSSKEGDSFRQVIFKKGISPSSYGAANVDELWAESVEEAAMGRNVSSELKKLIYATITGIGVPTPIKR